MTNLATALKTEIQRVARKEIRAQTEQLRKASSQYRRDIAALKRQLAALQRGAKLGRKPVQRPDASPTVEDGTSKRFSAKGLRSHRTRLGLSAREAGKLLGVSAQSVNNWEERKAVPRAAQIELIAALRAMGKREARERIDAIP
jgi:DNA-binding transcriptional regulator YiaG